MNGLRLSWLQWTYPMVLWMIVAFFTMLACKNVVGSNWTPAQSGSISEAHTFQSAEFVANQSQESAPAGRAAAMAMLSR